MDLLVKMLRVNDNTYALVMDFVGQIQIERQKRVSVDTALNLAFSNNKIKKDLSAWKKLETVIFNGPKTNCVEEIDLMQ